MISAKILCKDTFTFMTDNKLEKLRQKINNVDDRNLFCISSLYFILDNADEGYKHLNQYIELQGIGTLTQQDDIITSPLWENLRKDPRYIDLLKKLKLYDYWKDDPEIKKLEKGK